jgi:molybdopterin/thiamine biosynthesis adenylyltransferase
LDRYVRNKELVNGQEQLVLGQKTVAVVGLGGLGGHIAEQLARLGFGHLVLIDGDRVDETNLNRQLFATERFLGMAKTVAATLRLREVNSAVKYSARGTFLTPENGYALLYGADIVMDAVDNPPTRLLLQKLCGELDIPLVHGAIGGWWGQVSVVFPGDRTIAQLYPVADAVGVEAQYGNPAFTPGVIASIQTAEALKYCLGRPGILRGKLLRVDLLEHDYHVMQI